MKIGIVTATFKRSDGKTPFYLSRLFQSLQSQCHQDFKFFLIGDDYEDEQEFISLPTHLPAAKLFRKNLRLAVERKRYPEGSHELWCSGGTNAFNYGIDVAVSEGYRHIALVDHDDFWTSNHLSLIASVFEKYPLSAAVFASSTYIQLGHLPRGEIDGQIKQTFPEPENVIKSAVCINFGDVHIRFRDVFEETGTPYPSDADFWRRLRTYCDSRNLASFHIAQVTTFHEEEGSR